LLDLFISCHQLIALPSLAACHYPHTVPTPSRPLPLPLHHSLVVVVVVVVLIVATSIITSADSSAFTASHVSCLPPALSQVNVGAHGYAWVAAPAFQGFNPWYFDSGASHHMTAHSQLFTQRQAIHPKSILIANGNSISAIAASTACIAVISDSGVSCVDLSGTLLAPALKTNLISVSRLVCQGLVVTFQNNAVVVLDEQQRILARGVKEHGLFCLVYCNKTRQCQKGL
jgi:hypothetical protein